MTNAAVSKEKVEGFRSMLRMVLRSLGVVVLLGVNSCFMAQSVDVVKPPASLATEPAKLQRLLKAQCRFEGPEEEYFECLTVLASRLPPLDPAKRDHFGERYSPTGYLDCRKKTFPSNTACDYLKLRRQENPTSLPYEKTQEPKLPGATKTSVYRLGMTSKEYFEALCKAEAGEFIYKRVEGVEGVYQLRPRRYEGEEAKQDRFVMEDPYGYSDWEARSPSAFLDRRNYRYVEVPHTDSSAQAGFSVHRYQPDLSSDRSARLSVERDDSLRSRYGYLWRGISRPHDRENLIAGGEVIVLDLTTNEILAVKRGFVLGGPVPNSPTRINWSVGLRCPGDNKGVFSRADFVLEVLKPAR